MDMFSVFDKFFKDRGFTNRKNTWYKREPHAWKLFEYQRSKFSDRVYLNFGVYFEFISGSVKAPPKGFEWHLFGRVDDFANGEKLSSISEGEDSGDQPTVEQSRYMALIEGQIFDLLELLSQGATLEKAIFDNKQILVQNVRESELIKMVQATR
jgi:hypothetical protein